MADDHYKVLGLNKGASADEIRATYKKLCLQFHPDKVSPEEAEQAAIKFRAVQDAFKVVGDETARAQYDAQQAARAERAAREAAAERKRKADELEAEILSKPRPLPQLREEFARRSISTPVQVGRVSMACRAADPARFKQALKLSEVKAQSAALRMLLECWGDDDKVSGLISWMTEKGVWDKANKEKKEA